jgi:hypothetical protein
MRIRVASVMALLLLLVLSPASAQTATTGQKPVALEPTAQCPQADIDTLQRVITFAQSRSWAEKPESTAFLLSPDTATCRVVMKINKVTNAEAAALQRGGENRLVIEETKDNAKPNRLPLLLWLVFGGAGLVFVFVRYGRR